MKHASIFVNPDDQHILSATDTEAVLLSRDEDDRFCILRVSREIYFLAMTSWLDHKADYAKRWDGEFCGVGTINFDGSLLEGREGWLNLNDIPTEVKTYTAEKFDVDMEHG